jgi:hypothetical protein
MLVSKLLSECSAKLIDTGNTRWTAAELLDYYNMGSRVICSLDHSAYVVRSIVSLTTGTFQTLPNSGNRLVQVTRNMGTSGVSPGRNITLVNKEIFDRTYPGWAVDTAATQVIHYMYDASSPRFWYCYPQSNGTGTVEIIYSATPTDSTDTSLSILLKPNFIPALYEYILYMAYDKDSDNPNSAQKASLHSNNFKQMLGGNNASDMDNNPNLLETPPMRKK